jgi:hypothetical protein
LNVLSLNQDSAPTGAVAADRFWRVTPVLDPGGAQARLVIPPITIGSLVPAGTSDLVNNTFTFPPDPLPANGEMLLRVREAGAPGSLCRTRPVAPLPPSGTKLRILVAPPIAKSATDLNALVASFQGIQSGTPAGVRVNITSTSLTPQADGLHLRLRGTLLVNNVWHLRFDHRLRLNLTPLNGTDVNQVLTVQSSDPGTLALQWIGTPPANGDAILTLVQASMKPQMRSTVLSKAGPLVNSNVTSLHDVRWWTEQGFSLSVRRVTYSTTDLKVYAALCRLG